MEIPARPQKAEYCGGCEHENAQENVREVMTMWEEEHKREHDACAGDTKQTETATPVPALNAATGDPEQ